MDFIRNLFGKNESQSTGTASNQVHSAILPRVTRRFLRDVNFVPAGNPPCAFLVPNLDILEATAVFF